MCEHGICKCKKKEILLGLTHPKAKIHSTKTVSNTYYYYSVLLCELMNFTSKRTKTNNRGPLHVTKNINSII